MGFIKRAVGSWRRRSVPRKLFDILLAAFAAAGFGILAAWLALKLGFTNDRGGLDKNHRYLATVSAMGGEGAHADSCNFDAYAKLALLAHFYPENARHIMDAATACAGAANIDQMIAAASLYDDSTGLAEAMGEIDKLLSRHPMRRQPNAIPWMATEEWQLLKPALVKDTAAIYEAARLTGVEARLIAACLVGEQIRLFNTKREKVKKYLGPMKVLAVENQLSWGVNGIKEHTAIAVERNLKDSLSLFYMGRQYEHILDFETDDTATERYNRIVNFRDHTYSYIYTGCILHQTKMQWQRAGYDISSRPDILVTLFNLGFNVSKPKPNPVCGGSRVDVDGRTYTFGALGFDFYYSGELADVFPYTGHCFAEADKPMAIHTGDMLRLGDTIVTHEVNTAPKIRMTDTLNTDSAKNSTAPAVAFPAQSEKSSSPNKDKVISTTDTVPSKQSEKTVSKTNK